MGRFIADGKTKGGIAELLFDHINHQSTATGLTPCGGRAADGARTRNFQLGKLVRYQLRHSRLVIVNIDYIICMLNY